MTSSAPAARYAIHGRLAVEIHPDRAALGRAAARSAAHSIGDTITRSGEARVVFACAPSQDEFLAALVDPAVCGRAINWDRVTVFHMDDYIGLPADHPRSFRTYLKRHLLDHITPRAFHPLEADATDIADACTKYEHLLAAGPIDLVCMGIGENGHIAFNDPPVANFEDPRLVRIVELDPACRRQQVNDGCFPTFDAVPPRALSLTIPLFRRAHRLSIHVPGPRKAAAVRSTLLDPISTTCPASILRLHPAATLYLDPAAAGLL